MDHTHISPPTTHTFKDFAPLIGALGVILIFTYITSGQLGAPTAIDIMRLFMSGFFLVFGLFKIVKWSGFVTAYKEYDVLAQRSTLYAYLYPAIEIGLGIAYFYAWNLLAVNIVTLVLMLIGSYGVWLKLKLKEDIPCACLGVVFKLPMTKVTLFEDVLMATMALSMIISLL